MIPSVDRPWPVGALVRNRGDTTAFGALMVLGYQSNGQVKTISVAPPPWATRAERCVRAFFESALQSCDLLPPEGR